MVINIDIFFKKLSPLAVVPTYGSLGAGGFDIFPAIDEAILIPPGEMVAIPTGLAMELPSDVSLLVTPRSGWAMKNQLTIQNTPGLVDCDYRGEVKILLRNEGSETFYVKPDKAIAQGVIIPRFRAFFHELSQLQDSQRGQGGFGSTTK